MLFVLFSLDDDRYAFDAESVVEVLPFLNLKEIPRAPKEVAGVFDYRGAPVPVIDLCEVALGRPARRILSTRILLTNYDDDSGERHVLGFIVESAGETLRRDPGSFLPSGVANEAAPYLGPLTSDADGLVQRIDLERVLPNATRDLLFCNTAQPA